MAAPRATATVLVVEAPIERQIGDFVRGQGAVNPDLAIDKTKKEFLRAARPLLAKGDVAAKTIGPHPITQQVVWDALQVLRIHRGGFTGAETSVSWLTDGIADFRRQLGGGDETSAILIGIWERFTGKLAARQRAAACWHRPLRLRHQQRFEKESSESGA